MKPDYKNWFPKGMIIGFWVGAVVCVALALITGFKIDGTIGMILAAILWLGVIVLVVAGIWGIKMHNAFSYDGDRKMSAQIIEDIAEYVKLPKGGKGLDVGCGSGALAIAVAKRNSNAGIIGIDRWGKDYASFSMNLCESNAKAEGVSNTSFKKGDALKLEFPDETFDAVFSNYVYHNIPSKDRQAILLETLRTLKKGGTFALHDIFSKEKYGNMEAFLETLKILGYEEMHLLDTTEGIFMTPKEAKWMMLSGSALLYGKK